MMNIDLSVNLVSVHRKITTQITSDNVIANRSPLCGVIEPLIQIPIKPEGLHSNLTIKSEILKPFSKCWDPN